MISDQQASDDGQAQLPWLTQKLGQVAREEMGAFQPRILLLQMAAAPVPPYVGGRLRGLLMRLAGLQVGRHTTILGMPRMYGYGDLRQRLTIGNYAILNLGCHFDLNDAITISPHAGLGHEVMILTASHRIADADHRIGALVTAPVTIGMGAWIGARALILPGVTVGAGSIVAAGAVVTRDVPPNTVAAGVPARVIRQLEA